MKNKILMFFALLIALAMLTASVPVIENKKSDNTEIKKGEYRIITQRNIDRITVHYNGYALDQVRFTFNKGFAPNDINNIRLSGDSGSQEVSDNFTGFTNIEFPFRGRISYTTPSKFRAYDIHCEFEIEILQPGNWEINLVK